MKRRRCRVVRVGGVKVGGDAPVSVQSMTKTKTSSLEDTVRQIKALEKAGCEIVRLAVKDPDDAKALKEIKRRTDIPVVADIHFDHRLALESIKSGADKIRLNPGNMRKVDEIREVVRSAKRAGIPIRIGVNSGSVLPVHGPRSTVHGKNVASGLVEAALRYVKLFEEMDFYDIIISLKASDVVSTIDAYRRIAARCDYPLHLGVTAAGPHDSGIVKSSIGIGTLLLDGIGDTIRVSLTADPVDEVIAARRILSAVGLRRFGHDIISCPTCGRCQVDLGRIVRELERKLTAQSPKPKAHGPQPLTIAVMGCEVNGPGEAREADIGIAAGKGSGVLFRDGKILKRLKEKDFVKGILKLIAQSS
ncbi:MAG: flavodoxin-dependent (E)-4-hydroxy-3-methylbut-2-enyl-diphosphate synthase [Candidatus Omnitrophota bacterium]